MSHFPYDPTSIAGVLDYRIGKSPGLLRILIERLPSPHIHRILRTLTMAEPKSVEGLFGPSGSYTAVLSTYSILRPFLLMIALKTIPCLCSSTLTSKQIFECVVHLR